MKKLIVCAAIVGMLLCGCSGSSSNSRFIKVENHGTTRYVLVDTETNVLYLKFDRGITALLNADGTPMLWGE